jgi:hypothetical protein
VKWDKHITKQNELLGDAVFFGEYIRRIYLTFDVFYVNLTMLTCVSDGHVADVHVTHAPVCPSLAPVDGTLVVVVDQGRLGYP